MIYVNLKGRIGNNLFQIAAACSLAKRLGVSFKAIITSHETPDGRLLADYLTPFRNNLLRNVELVSEVPAESVVYNETYFHYQPLPEKDNLTLDGFFQSEKYFDEQAVRELFRIDPETEQYIRSKYKKLLDRHPVCIQVRRGDFLKLEKFYTHCTLSYYRRGMHHFPKDTIFLISSDDIAWCKAHFKGKQFYFIEDETVTVSLYLQSMCSHYILSNSTFSWWGAWLNPDPAKIVLYPDPWFGYIYREELKTIDLCPSSWKMLPVYRSSCEAQLNDIRVSLKYYYSRVCYFFSTIFSKQ